jgi:hypothetical protein
MFSALGLLTVAVFGIYFLLMNFLLQTAPGAG